MPRWGDETELRHYGGRTTRPGERRPEREAWSTARHEKSVLAFSSGHHDIVQGFAGRGSPWPTHRDPAARIRTRRLWHLSTLNPLPGRGNNPDPYPRSSQPTRPLRRESPLCTCVIQIFLWLLTQTHVSLSRSKDHSELYNDSPVHVILLIDLRLIFFDWTERGACNIWKQNDEHYLYLPLKCSKISSACVIAISESIQCYFCPFLFIYSNNHLIPHSLDIRFLSFCVWHICFIFMFASFIDVSPMSSSPLHPSLAFKDRSVSLCFLWINFCMTVICCVRGHSSPCCAIAFNPASSHLDREPQNLRKFKNSDNNLSSTVHGSRECTVTSGAQQRGARSRGDLHLNFNVRFRCHCIGTFWSFGARVSY